MATEKQDQLAEIRERFAKAEEYWAEDRRKALEDIKFRGGEQWPENLKREREAANRPCLTVDKLNQYVRQVVNDGRQNRPSIKVRPVDGGADVATAEVLQGLIRHIEDQSCADEAYDTALDSAATCGQGYFRVLSEYEDPMTFTQVLRIRRIRNPLTVIIDPMTQRADGSDMSFAFLLDDMTKEDFEATYPQAEAAEWGSDQGYTAGWFGETIRVCEYWWVEEVEKKLHLMVDGSVVPATRLKELEEAGLVVEGLVQQTRTVTERKVKWAKISGKEFLEGPIDWPGKWIPIFPVWGNELDLEGVVTHSGLIRPGRDAQQLYNYSRSAFAERVALTPKAPWVAAEGQVEDHSAEWETANVENHSVLRYKPISIGGSAVPPPQRQSAADVPVGFAQDMQLSEHDIQAAIGMYSASLGAPSNERSGKAIMARQREGDVGTFHYHDNLNRAIRHCGRVLVDLIPKTYDTARVVRVLGTDGKPAEAQFDPTIPAATVRGGVGEIHNPSIGTYDVTIATGPSYTSLRQEAASAMTELVQANPTLMGVVGDLLVKNMDWPGADEIADRLKLTLLPEIQKHLQEKERPTVSPEVQQLQAQFEQVVAGKDQSIAQAVEMIEKLQGEMAELKAEQELKSAEIRIKEYAAETDRLKVVGVGMTPEQVAAVVIQTMSELTTPLAQGVVEANAAPEAAETGMEY